ncbi:TolB family protein [Aneurinibacillus sp. REN35]|uniref:TolB family protein n=1 Tax=Aneurinibacillus sp. REN35 TaxID=3237286 RepID=UPI003528F492
MKKFKIILVVPALLLTITACASEATGNKTVIKEEPGKTITVIDDDGKKAGNPDISVEKIVRYENMEVSDWWDENTVIVSKENEALDKMSQEELSDSHPRSLYRYNLETKKFELLKEQKNLHLGDARLSPDKKHLIYQEYLLGDPLFFVMNLTSQHAFPLSGESIGGAVSAEWVDSDKIFGAAYSGTAYTATTAGKISAEKWTDDPLFIAEQINDTIYYNTHSNATLTTVDLKTKKKTSLKLDHVVGVYPSPDKKQMLVLQSNGSKETLILCDLNGENKKTLAEGTELGGVSWSSDQRMIAYSLKPEANSASGNSLYVYDLLSHEPTKLAVGIENAATSWSPSGKELVYTEWNGKQFKSSIVYLNFSLQK